MVGVEPAGVVLAGKQVEIGFERGFVLEDHVQVGEILAASAPRDRRQLHQRNVACVSDGEESAGGGIEQERIAYTEERQLGFVEQDGQRVIRFLECLVASVRGEHVVDQSNVQLVGAKEVQVFGNAMPQVESQTCSAGQGPSRQEGRRIGLELTQEFQAVLREYFFVHGMPSNSRTCRQKLRVRGETRSAAATADRNALRPIVSRSV